MTCEDTPVRLAWEIQCYEPYSRVWICKGYGRATTTADPADVAAAVLAGHLTVHPPRSGETFRALARPDTGQPVTVTCDQLPADGWTADAAVRQALPLYLREALAAG
ncbi:hypothetical protein ACTWJ9_33435 (plasmid) [Streptomyces sp. GDS52]|uniref:hypothetical protein n=1 Tax=Streptomyces sp. GDS52 TaxID=3406419 RepID=UPI003FD06FE4